MKVLLAHKFFHVTGGAEVFMFEVERVLRENGHDVVHFSTRAENNRESPFASYFVDPPQYKSGSIAKRATQVSSVIYSRKAKEEFARLLSDTKPDLIHVFAMHVHLTPSILVAAHEAGIPVVMSCNDYKHICPNYKLYHHGRICMDCKGGRFYKAISNRCCQGSLGFSVVSSAEAYAHKYLGVYEKYVHTFLFASEFMARATEEFWGANSFRWRKLRNPFDSQAFAISESPGDFALFFGRLVEEKGVDVLLQAAALAPEVPVKVVGDGPEEQRLREAAERSNLGNVQFLGPIWGDDLTALLRRSRFVVVPSVWHENYPYVINQSFAVGKPVIGSHRGGIPEMVSHGQHGIVYSADDPKALAEAMLALWRDPDYARQLGSNAKSFSDAEFNDENFYGQLSSIYSDVLDAMPRTGR